MIWDEVVDVVCTGSGAAGLACAIAADDIGGDVFLAGSRKVCPTHATVPASAWPTDRHPWLGIDEPDFETNSYFAELSSDVGPLSSSGWDGDLPIRVVRDAATVDSSGSIAPFFGARLRDWAARCLASPYGFLYTRVTDWPSTTLHTTDGDAIEVAEIGSMTPEPDDVAGSVFEWLTARARERGIQPHPGSSLERIVFEDGVPIGAVFTTPEGPLAVRARHGVLLATGDADVSPAARLELLTGDAAMRVCLVGQTASRFGRVELLTSEAVYGGAASACRPMKRQLQVNLHETHAYLQPWRCGKVHGYPSVGQ